MDPRLEAVVAEQLGSGLAGLAGSEARATIRISAPLLNQIVAASLPPGGAVRTLTVQPAAGNVLNVVITLARPGFLPPISLHLTIVRQPVLPNDPVLALRLIGGAGSVLKIAGPFLGGSLPLPPGIRLVNDLVLVDIRTLLANYGQASHLRYVRELRVTTDAGVMIVETTAGV